MSQTQNPSYLVTSKNSFYIIFSTKNDINYLKVSNDSRRLLSFAKNDNIFLWDLDKMIILSTFNGKSANVIDMNGDGKVICMGIFIDLT